MKTMSQNSFKSLEGTYKGARTPKIDRETLAKIRRGLDAAKAAHGAQALAQKNTNTSGR